MKSIKVINENTVVIDGNTFTKVEPMTAATEKPYAESQAEFGKWVLDNRIVKGRQCKIISNECEDFGLTLEVNYVKYPYIILSNNLEYIPKYLEPIAEKPEKEWEVLAYELLGYIYKLESDGQYHWNMRILEEYDKSTIHSIRYKQEVFTVGDWVGNIGIKAKIETIYIDPKFGVCFNEEGIFAHKVTKLTPVFHISGTPVFDQDEFWVVFLGDLSIHKWLCADTEGCTNTAVNPDIKYFLTEQEAHECVEVKKPCNLTLNEIMVSYVNTNSSATFQRELQKLIKNKSK